ncbi:hypothetical protein F5Y18DRAFT_279029 [Xylariaceae sp. FL1019]|nr:hypothetical protein F5Y18DRAFT_279029 [Xylariaceae sp. FL1019]
MLIQRQIKVSRYISNRCFRYLNRQRPPLGVVRSSKVVILTSFTLHEFLANQHRRSYHSTEMSKTATTTTNLQLKQLPGSKQWVRSSLQDKTFPKLNTFRDRVNTNSIRYDFDIHHHGSKTATHKASIRVDLCGNTNTSQGHNGILFPHAQITMVMRANGANWLNVSATGLKAYLLRDGEGTSEIRDMIDHVQCPEGVLLWIYSELQTLSEFDGSKILLKPTRGRYVATRDTPPKTANVPADIMTTAWAGKRITIA